MLDKKKEDEENRVIQIILVSPDATEKGNSLTGLPFVSLVNGPKSMSVA